MLPVTPHEALHRTGAANSAAGGNLGRPVGTGPNRIRAWLIQLLFGDDMASPAELKSQIAALSVKVDGLIAMLKASRAKEVTDADVAALAEAAVQLEALADKIDAV